MPVLPGLSEHGVGYSNPNEVIMDRRLMALRCVAGLHLSILLVALPSWADADRRAGMKKAFLEQAAQGQQAEIALGQLATQQTSSGQVKQF